MQESVVAEETQDKATSPEPKQESAAPAEQTSAAKAFPQPDHHWFWGTGRRKTSIARVRIRPGDGKFMVNDKKYDEYFVLEVDRKDVMGPLLATETSKRVDVHVNVAGGGVTGQAGAVVMGLARALKTANPDYGPLLKDKGFLRRDARMVERKKPGQRGARRRFQFSKR